MNRLDELFGRKSKNILNVYCTAGYPNLEDTTKVLEGLEAAAVDLVELGMPYADPLADGKTIQASSMQALDNGMGLKVLFEQLDGIRERVSMPLILMGYLNPVLQFGLKRFLAACAKVGIDGLILPDLPLTEYERDYQDLFEQYGIYPIFLITPQTPLERIRKIDALSRGFVYAVSSASTTGKQSGFGRGQIQYFEYLQKLELNNPVLVGFGISDAASFRTVCEYVNGAVIGSAFIRALAKAEEIEKTIEVFVRGIRQAELLA